MISPRDVIRAKVAFALQNRNPFRTLHVYKSRSLLVRTGNLSRRVNVSIGSLTLCVGAIVGIMTLHVEAVRATPGGTPANALGFRVTGARNAGLQSGILQVDNSRPIGDCTLNGRVAIYRVYWLPGSTASGSLHHHNCHGLAGPNITVPE
jgi:hypothetical protein